MSEPKHISEVMAELIESLYGTKDTEEASDG